MSKAQPQPQLQIFGDDMVDPPDANGFSMDDPFFGWTPFDTDVDEDFAPRSLPIEEQPPVKQPPKEIQIFDMNVARRLHEQVTNEEEKKRLEPVLKCASSRRLACYSDDYPARLDELEKRFPNFGEVIEVLREHQFLGMKGDCLAPIELPHFLLDGPPGVGKTAFVMELAKLWGTGFEAIDMASAQTNGALCGLDHFYTGSQPGTLFNSLVLNGDTANPVIFLDELEKAKGDHRYSNHNALLNLLQKHSASEFKDLSLPGLPINASHVLWVATSNSTDPLPKPLLDRFMVFHIPAPTPEQSRVILRSVFANLCESYSWGSSHWARTVGNFDESVIDCLATRSPRNMYQALLQACAKAASCDRSYLLPEDVPPQVQPSSKAKNPCGFI